MGKFYLFSAAIQKGYVGLTIIAVLNSVLSVFYYFRVMVVMYMQEPASGQPDPEPIALPVLAIIVIAAFTILWLGIHPAQILNLATHSTIALQ